MCATQGRHIPTDKECCYLLLNEFTRQASDLENLLRISQLAS
jgi:hypothetical protein